MYLYIYMSMHHRCEHAPPAGMHFYYGGVNSRCERAPISTNRQQRNLECRLMNCSICMLGSVVAGACVVWLIQVWHTTAVGDSTYVRVAHTLINITHAFQMYYELIALFCRVRECAYIFAYTLCLSPLLGRSDWPAA